MIKEAIGHGKSVDEALEDAKNQLGLKDDEEFDFDIVSDYKKKILGIFGGSDAEVRVTVQRPDEKGKKAPKERKAPKEKKENNKKPAKKPASKPQVAAVPVSELAPESKALVAVKYLESILEHLGCQNTVMTVAENEGGALIILEGEDLGVIIGRRGETLDALQHLASLAARDDEGYYKVTLNIGNYREKREDALTVLAKRVAGTVLKSGKGKALEPMNPYERRIIHTAIQDIEGVTSASVGEGAQRRVVVVLEGHDVSEVYIGRPHGRGRYDRGRGGRYGRRDRKPSNTVSSAPTRAPRSDADLPLYGKIEKKTEE